MANPGADAPIVENRVESQSLPAGAERPARANDPRALLGAEPPAAAPPRPNTAAPLRVTLAANVNAGLLPQPAPEPLILPYIPDQTSYAGRNYMDMALSSEKFVPQISVDRNGNVITPQNTPAGIFAASAPSDPASSLSMSNPVTPEIITITFPGGTSITQTVQSAWTPPGQGGTSGPRSRMMYSGVAVPRKEGASGTGGTIINPPPTKFTAQFDMPSNNQTIQVSGNSASFTVSLTLTPPESGQARLINPAAPRLPTCTVTLDGATDVPMTVTGPDISGLYSAASNAPLTFGTSGAHTLAATASFVGENSNPKISFAIQLNAIGGGGGGNATPPALVVTSPLDGSVIAAQFGDPNSPAEAVVPFTGSATSNVADIQSVQIQIGDDPSTASNATPNPAAGWSKWSGQQVLVGYGPQTAKITAVDSNGSSISQTIKLILAPFEPRLWLYSKLLIIEEVRLTNYTGQYGRGKVLRTLSLLPGETTNISVSSYSTQETTTTDTTSIFDELNDKTSSDFDTSVADEQADKSSQQDSEAWGIQAKASASWGWGSAEVTGNYKSDSNSAREDLRKSVKSATLKHAAERSSRRSVQVNAENQQTTTSGTTQSIQRTISNINVSRTLNFIFYQLNQEYISLLHLVDVRIGYVSAFLSLMDGTTQFDYQEVTLTDLPTLISKAIKSDFQADVTGNIMDILNNVVDYADVRHTLAETVVPTDEATGAPVPEASYFRFRRNLAGTWTDPNTGVSYSVPGVILGVTNVTMRTDGVLVDSALGQSPALDDYNVGLQQASLQQRLLANAAAQQVIDLVNNPDPNKTDAWQKTHPQELPASLNFAAAVPPSSGGSGG